MYHNANNNLPPLSNSGPNSNNSSFQGGIVDVTTTNNNNNDDLPMTRKDTSKNSNPIAGMDKEALRRFYMSPGKNFGAFTKKTGTGNNNDGGVVSRNGVSTPNP